MNFWEFVGFLNVLLANSDGKKPCSYKTRFNKLCDKIKSQRWSERLFLAKSLDLNKICRVAS